MRYALIVYIPNSGFGPHPLSQTLQYRMKHLSVLLLFFASLSLGAQTTFTGHLRAAGQGKGVVVVIQSDEIEQAVNRKSTKTAVSSAKDAKTNGTQTPVKHANASTEHQTKTAEKHQTPDTAHKSHTESERVGHTSETTEHNGTASSKHYTERARRKTQGYRICIYTGGNSRADREKAVAMGNKCRAKFSELASYPNFIAPRWVTYVGDFRTREEAQKYVTRIRRANISYEVRIVKSEVNLPY